MHHIFWLLCFFQHYVHVYVLCHSRSHFSTGQFIFQSYNISPAHESASIGFDLEEFQMPWLDFQTTSPGWIRMFTNIRTKCTVNDFMIGHTNVDSGNMELNTAWSTWCLSCVYCTVCAENCYFYKCGSKMTQTSNQSIKTEATWLLKKLKLNQIKDWSNKIIFWKDNTSLYHKPPR